MILHIIAKYGHAFLEHAVGQLLADGQRAGFSVTAPTEHRWQAQPIVVKHKQPTLRRDDVQDQLKKRPFQSDESTDGIDGTDDFQQTLNVPCHAGWRFQYRSQLLGSDAQGIFPAEQRHSSWDQGAIELHADSRTAFRRCRAG